MFGISKENSIEFNCYLMLLKLEIFILKCLVFLIMNSKYMVIVKYRFVVIIL